MTPQTPTMPSRGGLLARLAIAAVVGTLIVVCVIMPAEYRKDPTGFGRLTGLLDLTRPVADEPETAADAAAGPAQPEEGAAIARYYDQPYRTETIKIPLRLDEELEYKVQMKEGQAMVYSWEVSSGSVYYDFHGEPADPEKSQDYKKVDGTKSANGVFVAPFDGKHGWYWLNLSDTPIEITLKISGFYEGHDYVR